METKMKVKKMDLCEERKGNGGMTGGMKEIGILPIPNKM